MVLVDTATGILLGQKLIGPSQGMKMEQVECVRRRKGCSRPCVSSPHRSTGGHAADAKYIRPPAARRAILRRYRRARTNMWTQNTLVLRQGCTRSNASFRLKRPPSTLPPDPKSEQPCEKNGLELRFIDAAGEFGPSKIGSQLAITQHGYFLLSSRRHDLEVFLFVMNAKGAEEIRQAFETSACVLKAEK